MVSPFRYAAQSGDISGYMYYTNNEIFYNTTAKTFIIDHPDNKDKYLVHGCLEGPELGVYYRGKGEIINNQELIIDLPDYIRNLASDFTIQVTAIYDGEIKCYNVSDVIDNKFIIYGKNGRFNWLVHAMRNTLITEPNRSDISIHGNGPYKWYSTNK